MFVRPKMEYARAKRGLTWTIWPAAPARKLFAALHHLCNISTVVIILTLNSFGAKFSSLNMYFFLHLLHGILAFCSKGVKSLSCSNSQGRESREYFVGYRWHCSTGWYVKVFCQDYRATSCQQGTKLTAANLPRTIIETKYCFDS